MKKVLKEGYAKSREYHIITKDGSRIPVEMSVAIMKDADGKPMGFVGISRDITERKRVEEERNKLLHDYRERIKELRCVYRMSKLVEKPGISLEEVLQGTANLLPPAYQYSDIACARIVFGKREFKTKNFKELAGNSRLTSGCTEKEPVLWKSIT